MAKPIPSTDEIIGNISSNGYHVFNTPEFKYDEFSGLIITPATFTVNTGVGNRTYNLNNQNELADAIKIIKARNDLYAKQNTANYDSGYDLLKKIYDKQISNPPSSEGYSDAGVSYGLKWERKYDSSSGLWLYRPKGDITPGLNKITGDYPEGDPRHIPGKMNQMRKWDLDQILRIRAINGLTGDTNEDWFANNPNRLAILKMEKDNIAQIEADAKRYNDDFLAKQEDDKLAIIKKNETEAERIAREEADRIAKNNETNNNNNNMYIEFYVKGDPILHTVYYGRAQDNNKTISDAYNWASNKYGSANIFKDKAGTIKFPAPGTPSPKDPMPDPKPPVIKNTYTPTTRNGIIRYKITDSWGDLIGWTDTNGGEKKWDTDSGAFIGITPPPKDPMPDPKPDPNPIPPSNTYTLKTKDGKNYYEIKNNTGTVLGYSATQGGVATWENEADAWKALGIITTPPPGGGENPPPGGGEVIDPNKIPSDWKVIAQGYEAGGKIYTVYKFPNGKYGFISQDPNGLGQKKEFDSFAESIKAIETGNISGGTIQGKTFVKSITAPNGKIYKLYKDNASGEIGFQSQDPNKMGQWVTSPDEEYITNLINTSNPITQNTPTGKTFVKSYTAPNGKVYRIYKDNTSGELGFLSQDPNSLGTWRPAPDEETLISLIDAGNAIVKPITEKPPVQGERDQPPGLTYKDKIQAPNGKQYVLYTDSTGKVFFQSQSEDPNQAGLWRSSPDIAGATALITGSNPIQPGQRTGTRIEPSLLARMIKEGKIKPGISTIDNADWLKLDYEDRKAAYDIYTADLSQEQIASGVKAGETDWTIKGKLNEYAKSHPEATTEEVVNAIKDQVTYNSKDDAVYNDFYTYHKASTIRKDAEKAGTTQYVTPEGEAAQSMQDFNNNLNRQNEIIKTGYKKALSDLGTSYKDAISTLQKVEGVSEEAKNEIISNLANSYNERKGLLDKETQMITDSYGLKLALIETKKAGENSAIGNMLKARGINTNPLMLQRLIDKNNVEFDNQIKQIQSERLDKLVNTNDKLLNIFGDKTNAENQAILNNLTQKIGLQSNIATAQKELGGKQAEIGMGEIKDLSGISATGAKMAGDITVAEKASEIKKELMPFETANLIAQQRSAEGKSIPGNINIPSIDNKDIYTPSLAPTPAIPTPPKIETPPPSSVIANPKVNIIAAKFGEILKNNPNLTTEDLINKTKDQVGYDSADDAIYNSLYSKYNGLSRKKPIDKKPQEGDVAGVIKPFKPDYQVMGGGEEYWRDRKPEQDAIAKILPEKKEENLLTGMKLPQTFLT